ncbi:DEAD/DEAH box helicase [Prevotella sp. kh1p2]|uniref:DEAD/DEAH box helicase n=1 Tax=Prevotella sp. kh1p2 TaxID=1761883 RepID=UPI0008C61E02|nr:DEAD/DEAH box helicase [Prevotella sp. kh1p2]SET04892.1 Superfamily II DNA and RNA helicase [Prevotella sp. kh1p2]SNU11748.1 Superfamily II DNA and RNA helicase [Prevotellaceae bacterium KH2P17]
MYFDELDLNDNVLDALYDMRFDECTPVQEQCIPEILKGNDVLGVAQTGTGKTAAYLLPILSKLDDGGYPKDAINCIIMSPTRELAQQIDQAMQGFGYYLQGVSSVAVYGGNDGNRYDQEIKSLRLGADVIIATPGRFISHLSLGNVDMSKVSFFILDEADRMLDMGFSEDILAIAKHLPSTCQTIMFSATMPAKIEQLAKTLLHNPVEIKLAVSKPAEKIQQSAYVCYEPQKLGVLRELFKHQDMKRVIIFSGKKTKVKDINRALCKMGVNSGEMHSDLTQAERDEMMFRFKSGKLDVLVATDILARGIDIDDLAVVINYDVPHDVEDYVHRIGRTARADRDGAAITFVNEDDMFYFQQIERFLEKTITKTPLPAELGDGPEYRSLSKPMRGQRFSGKSARGGKGHGAKGHDRKASGNRSNKGTTAPLEAKAGTAADSGQGNSRKDNRQNRRRRSRQHGKGNERNDNSGGQTTVTNEATE